MTQHHETREDGREYATPTTGETLPCEWCGALLDVHREGRRPRFCGPTCRQRHYRASRLF